MQDDGHRHVLRGPKRRRPPFATEDLTSVGAGASQTGCAHEGRCRPWGRGCAAVRGRRWVSRCLCRRCIRATTVAAQAFSNGHTERKLMPSHLLGVRAEHGHVLAGVAAGGHLPLMRKRTNRPVVAIPLAAGYHLRGVHAKDQPGLMERVRCGPCLEAVTL
jgi:hypothetical protein